MFSDPLSVIAQLYLQPGVSVADLGCGIGAYSIPLARAIGPSGKVYACDVQKDLLVRLENEMRSQSIMNIQTVHSNIETHEGTKLREGSVDWVILANVLFQTEHRPELAREAYRILKPGGSLLLVDWSESFGNLGPHAKDVVTAVEAEKIMGEAGFHTTPQMLNAGSHHYGIVFKK